MVPVIIQVVLVLQPQLMLSHDEVDKDDVFPNTLMRLLHHCHRWKMTKNSIENCT